MIVSANVWTADTLRRCLLTIPTVELKGMALLRECRPISGFFPTGIPREPLIEAVMEIVAYTERSQRAAEALANLTPIPLKTFDVLEYGL